MAKDEELQESVDNIKEDVSEIKEKMKPKVVRTHGDPVVELY